MSLGESGVLISKESTKKLWLISVGHGMTHWYPATFYLLLPIIGNEMGLSYSQIGFIMTTKTIVSMISNIPGGMIVDLTGRKGLLMAIALFWIGIPYLFLSTAHNYWTTLLCMALIGAGNTIWHPTAIPLLSQLYPQRRGLAVSIHAMGANVGDAVAPLAIGALLVSLNWREVVVINVIPGIVMGIVILLLLYRTEFRKESMQKPDTVKKSMNLPNYFKGFGALVKNKSLILLSVSSGFRSMTQASLNIFLPLYLVHELNFSPFLLGLSLFVLQASGFVATPISGHVSDKLGRKKIIMTSMAMTAVVLLFMAVAGKSVWFILFVAVLGFFLYSVRPVLQAWLLENTPKQMEGTSISLLFSMQNVFSAASPLVGGMIGDAFGLYAVFLFVAVTIVIANFLIFFMPADGRQTPTAQHTA